MNNVVILMGGAGARMAGKGRPKPFLNVGEKYLYQIALNSALTHLPNSRTYAVLSKANQSFVMKNRIHIDADELFALSHETKGPAETARQIPIQNNDPIYFVDCDLYFVIPANVREVGFDCKLFHYYSENGEHSFLREQDGRVLEIAEKIRISEKGIVGIYGFKNKTYYDEIYDQTIFEGENFMSNVCQTALSREDKVIAEKCVAHLPLGTSKEFDRNREMLDGL